MTDAAITLRSLADLPPTLDGHQAAEILGCSYWTLLELRKRGECPVEPLKLGRVLRWPTLKVLETVGVTAEDGELLMLAASESEESGLHLVPEDA